MSQIGVVLALMSLGGCSKTLSIEASAPADPWPGCSSFPAHAVEKGLRLPVRADVHPQLLELDSGTQSVSCPAVSLDFNGDGTLDHAAVLLDAGGRGLVVVREGATGALRTMTTAPALSPPAHYLGLGPKAAGEPGPAGRDNWLQGHPDRQEEVTASAGFELCRPATTDAEGRPDPVEASNLCYCSEFYLFIAGEWKTELVCD